MKNTHTHNTNKKAFGFSMVLVSVFLSFSLVSAPALAEKKGKPPIVKPKPPIDRPNQTVCILLPQLCNR